MGVGVHDHVPDTLPLGKKNSVCILAYLVWAQVKSWRISRTESLLNQLEVDPRTIHPVTSILPYPGPFCFSKMSNTFLGVVFMRWVA